MLELERMLEIGSYIYLVSSPNLIASASLEHLLKLQTLTSSDLESESQSAWLMQILCDF